jgi:hypothetical protein
LRAIFSHRALRYRSLRTKARSIPETNYFWTWDSEIVQHVPEPAPVTAFPLTAAVQPLVAYPARLLVKGIKQGDIPADTIVVIVPTQFCTQFLHDTGGAKFTAFQLYP